VYVLPARPYRSIYLLIPRLPPKTPVDIKLISILKPDLTRVFRVQARHNPKKIQHSFSRTHSGSNKKWSATSGYSRYTHTYGHDYYIPPLYQSCSGQEENEFKTYYQVLLAFFLPKIKLLNDWYLRPRLYHLGLLDARKYQSPLAQPGGHRKKAHYFSNWTKRKGKKGCLVSPCIVHAMHFKQCPVPTLCNNTVHDIGAHGTFFFFWSPANKHSQCGIMINWSMICSIK
jgi:hypothetical protein